MSGEKKSHRSLRELLKLSASSSPTPEAIESNLHSTDAQHSHRFFLRSRDSKGSSSSRSSASSLKSLNGNASDGESMAMSPSVSSSQIQSDSESSSSFKSVIHHENKDRSRKKGSKKDGRHESHLSLKRFFKILHPKDHSSDLPKTKSSLSLPSSKSQLAEKYDIGRLIGTGASGSVNLINAKNDPHRILAIKKFRSKLKTEIEQDYLRKVKNEFLVGEHLRHQNLIHTLELFEEKSEHTSSSEYYIVMEYCPFDFFNLVMSGLMRYEEICCYFRQIVHGVQHLHQSGIAHRDLKLDNCVVDKNGILKLIDFGSAFQFKKLVEGELHANSDDVMLDETHKLLFAKGIVGSDPYLAPEVFEPTREEGYDARLADVWSIAIIFCCMILKRFPWKLPKAMDPSYRAFACLNSANEPLTEEEILGMMTKEMNVGKGSPSKYGPDRLLSILPPSSRNLIAYMLKINTNERAYIEDVAGDQFFRSLEYCHYAEPREESEQSQFQVGGDESKESLPETVVQSPGPSESLGDDTTVLDTQAVGTIDEKAPADSEIFVKAHNHKHHLVTEKDLQKINAEKERIKRAKEAGIA